MSFIIHDPSCKAGTDDLADCSSHYNDWKETYPDRGDRFVPGGFGENFVTSAMNERNVCIGDVISVGSEVLLQVSLPRQPCFKLNHRFSLKNFAPNTYKTSRTGWYYRVIREGTVNVGDELRVVERKWPKWTIERVQEYLHRDKSNLAMNEELAAIEALGDESRGQFRNRVAKAKRAMNKANGEEEKKKDAWKDFRIVSRKMQTPRIMSLELEATTSNPDAEELPLGAHAKLKLPNGLVRSYSIVSEEGTKANKIELGIALDPNSRGGSKYLHESAKPGDILQVGKITADVAPNGAASNHLFIVGGIGITAFLSLIKACLSVNWSCQLHYAIRSEADLPFRDSLESIKQHVITYDKSKGERMDIKKIVNTRPWGSQLYVCGPNRLMEAAREAVDEAGITPDEVHFEAFAADISGDPFEVEVANKGGKVLQVGEDESLLDVLRKEFGDLDSSCEVGNCGTCKTRLGGGRVDHRGTALSPEEKESWMLSCVSRGIGRIAVEI